MKKVSPHENKQKYWERGMLKRRIKERENKTL